MIAPDAISPLARYAALVAEVPVIRIADPDARALGLREGQVVQALVETQGDARFFDFGGRRYEVPAAMQQVSPGDPRWFRVGRQGEAFVLRPIADPAASAQATNATSTSGSVNASSAGVVTTTPPTSQAVYSGPLSARFLELLARPSGFSALAQILVPGRLESVLIAAGAPDLARALIAGRLRSDALSPEAIRRAVAHSGMWGESMLASGQQIAQLDLKVLLRQISRVLTSKAAAVGAQVDEAINDIERKQIESIQQSVDGKLVFSVMLPFGDAPPASLRFERHRRSDERGEEGGYTIDLHITPPRVGDLWMKTTVVGTRVDVTVWASKQEVAKIVSAASRQLGDDLMEAGLALRAFNVLEGVRPESNDTVEKPISSGLDLRA
jgi:hypothetical protein